MDRNSANKILESVQNIKNDYFDKLDNTTFDDADHLESRMLKNMTTSEFVYLAKKVIKQFQDVFSSRDNTILFPRFYSFNGDNEHDIVLDVENFIASFDDNDIRSAEDFLESLLYYQTLNGFIRNTLSDYEFVDDNIGELSERLRIIQSRIESKGDAIDSLIKVLKEERLNMESLINQKKEELNQITVNLSTANAQSNQIADVLNKVVENGSRSAAILEQQETNKTQSQRVQESLRQLYEDERETLSGNSQDIASKIEQFDKIKEDNLKHLAFIEGKKSFFDERIEYLNDLIGREVGVSLFETFKQRKVELKTQVDFWKWAVPVMTVLCVVWIVCIFRNQASIENINLWWQMFGLNSLKTLPSILLLYFTINQYRKERNFQEEYAFKSAVALTIDAYAGRLKDDVNKDQLIMDAVFKLYKTPIEDKQSNAKVKSKHVWDLINKSTDTISNLTKSPSK